MNNNEIKYVIICWLFYIPDYYLILWIIKYFELLKGGVVSISVLAMHSIVTIAFAKFLKDLLLRAQSHLII